MSIPEQAPEVPALAQLGKNGKFGAAHKGRGFDARNVRETPASPSDSYLHFRRQRAERYRLKYQATRILDWKSLHCCRRVAHSQSVEVWRNPGLARARYAGLMTCQSVWVCPCCSAHIAEARRAELTAAVQNWQAKGGTVLMLTLTVPHYDGDELRGLLDGLLGAHRDFVREYSFRQWRDSIGLAGRVRALEVTHGSNGFHPHLHILLFLEGQLFPEVYHSGESFTSDDQAEWKRTLEAREVAFNAFAARQVEVLYPLWARVCERNGLGRPSLERGVNLIDSRTAAEYVAKWGLEDEATKSHYKQGNASRSPWDLLRDADHPDEDRAREARRLFEIFANAFKRRHQLQWSRGLRELVELEPELDDQELPEETFGPEDYLLGSLTRSQWKAIAGGRYEVAVLEVADQGNWAHVEKLAQVLGVKFTGASMSGGGGATTPSEPKTVAAPEAPFIPQVREYDSDSDIWVIMIGEGSEREKKPERAETAQKARKTQIKRSFDALDAKNQAIV